MKKNHGKKRIVVYLKCAAIGSAIAFGCLSGGNSENGRVYATGEIHYTYDKLGRVITATYPDGICYEYRYDGNGNLLSISGTSKEGDGEGDTTTEAGSTTTEAGGTTTESGSTTTEAGGTSTESGSTSTEPGNIPTGEGQLPAEQMEERPPIGMNESAEDIASYHSFRKRKPVIKSLKWRKKKGKRYVELKIKQVMASRIEGETGYQIQYGTDKKLKKRKVLQIERHAKNSITKTTWKGKKNKTYYVRVRAYRKTRRGKIIYTKYSKVENVKVK